MKKIETNLTDTIARFIDFAKEDPECKYCIAAISPSTKKGMSAFSGSDRDMHVMLLEIVDVLLRDVTNDDLEEMYMITSSLAHKVFDEMSISQQRKLINNMFNRLEDGKNE